MRSFLNNQNISLGNDSLLVSVRNIWDKETFLESGIIASLLDYLSTLNETDFGELIQYADFPGEKVDIDTLPPEFHEDIIKIVENFSDLYYERLKCVIGAIVVGVYVP